MSEPPPTARPIQSGPSARGWLRWLPGVQALRAYRGEWLLKDLTAGLVLTAILVPVGMGYAEVSGLPPITGLYATIVPLLAYAIFGPSRILVLGPDSSLAAIIAATIVPLAAGDPERLIDLAGMLSLFAGALCVLAGLARLGFVTELLSKPVRLGYLHGIALTVLVGQMPKILGFSAEGESLSVEAFSLVRGMIEGHTNLVAFAIGAGSLVLILVCKRCCPKVPGVLLAVVAGTLVAELFDLARLADLAVVGPLPRGLPAPNLPSVRLEDLGTLAAGAAAIALVSFADTSVLSRTYAARTGQTVDPNQEFVALGAANVAAGVTGGFAVSSSSSRTPVAESAGARTQLTGVVGALCIVLLLLVVPNLLASLPSAVLGAVVISAALSLIDLREVARLWKLRPSELGIALLCFLGVASIGVLEGIFAAIGVAIVAFFWRAWRPYDAVLGRVDGLKGYHDISRHPEARRVPGLVLFRWDAPLFFANAEFFHAHVKEAVAEAPTPTKWVVIAAEPVTEVDITAGDALSELDEELRSAGVKLCFAEMKGPAKDLLKRYGLYDRIGEEYFFRTLGQAVDAYLEEHPVPWVDWDESPSPAPG